MDEKIIIPRILSGFRDFLPETMIFRQKIIEKIRNTFESFGFDPLETPAIEYEDILFGELGPEAEKIIYSFEDKGKRRVGLRYDLTVPLARVVSMYEKNLPLPFKRYQMEKVWRGESPQRGRYREFWQCDVDIVGTKSPLADAEIIIVIFTTLRNLGFEKFAIQINDRDLLGGIAEFVGIAPDRAIEFYRIIDKIERDGIERVRSQIQGLGISQLKAEESLEMISIKGSDGFQILNLLEERLKGMDRAFQGINRIRKILENLGQFSVLEEYYKVSPSLARGLDYYTGPVFEVTVEEPKMGSIAGGGRYDYLTKRFGKDLPAVGASIGLERVIDILMEISISERKKAISEVIVVPFNETTLPEAIKYVQRLRGVDIKSEIYLNPASNVATQLSYANKKSIPVAVIVGPDEVQQKQVTVKNMQSGGQKTVPEEQLVATVQEILNLITQMKR